VGVEIRPIVRRELAAYVSLLEVAAGRRPGDEALADARAEVELDRTLAVFEDGVAVAATGSDLLELTVPGPRPVPAARITLTGVLPSRRRRGYAVQLARRQFRDFHDRGEPLAVLITTGPGFQRRIGLAPAARAAEVEIETRRGSLESGAGEGDDVRVLDDAERDRLLPEVYERHRRAQPGQIVRTPTFWRFWLLDRDRFRKGEPGDRFAVAYDDAQGLPQGYVTYRLRPGDPRVQPVDALVVEDLVAVTNEARYALWDFCLAFEQARRVVAHNVPVDEPLLWMLRDPRRLRVTRVRDFLWLRLVDVAAALRARSYGGCGELVLELADPLLPENTGRFLLTADEAGGACAATRRPPDLALEVADLGAIYLGDASFVALARAGRVRELAAGAIARADALFDSRPAPWTVSDW